MKTKGSYISVEWYRTKHDIFKINFMSLNLNINKCLVAFIDNNFNPRQLFENE